MKTKISLILIILLVLSYIVLLDYISMLNSTNPNDDVISFSSGGKYGVSFSYINGTFTVKDKEKILILGFNESNNSWGNGSVIWMLNGYSILDVDKSIPLDINLRIKNVGQLHADEPNRSAVLLVNKKEIKIPLNRIMVNRNGIIDYIPDKVFIDEVDNRNLVIHLNRDNILGDSEIKLTVPDNTGIDIYQISLDAHLKEEIGFINYRNLLFFTVVFIVIMGILIRYILKILKTDYGNIFLMALLLSIFMASFSEDIWDFPLWKTFSYYFYIANGNPALLWSENPLWTIIPIIFSSSYFLLIKLGVSMSPIILNVFLKIPIILAYLFIGFFIFKISTDILNISSAKKIKLFMILWFFNPFVIWQVMWGQRDLVSIAFFMVGIYFIFKNYRYHSSDHNIIMTGLLLSIAISIKSYIAFPMLPIILYVYYKSEKRLKDVLLIIFFIIVPFSFFYLLIPYDMLNSIFTFRMGLEGPIASNIDGMTWLTFLNRYLPGDQLVYLIMKYIFYIGIISILIILFLKYRVDSTVDLALKSIIFSIFVFYLSYKTMNPQFLLLALPIIILVLDTSFTVIYSVIAFLNFYSHIFDFHTFISTLLVPYTKYQFMVGSTMDTAIGFIFSILLVYYVLYIFCFDGRSLFYLSKSSIYFPILLISSLLPYMSYVEKYEGLITIMFSFISTVIWLFMIMKYDDFQNNREYVSECVNFFNYSNIILLTAIIYFLMTDPPYYIKSMTIVLFFMMLLMNIVSLFRYKLTFFIILINIFMTMTYGFYQSNGPIFVRIVQPQMGTSILLYSMIIINILFLLNIFSRNIKISKGLNKNGLNKNGLNS